MWGAATAAYQIEGAWLEGGKGLSIWDAFSHTPGKTTNGDTGDVAVDHYHKYAEDVGLMSELGLPAYRFSISWPRILPTGRKDHVNKEGIAFYSKMIDELRSKNIYPVVTLYHWDLPLALQTELDGWCDEKISDLFAEYARVCFEAFGDRVKHWITLNEPWCSAVLGYDSNGVHAPGRVKKSATEVYKAGHNLLLAHAKAAHVYRTEFAAKQKGYIGITLNSDWFEPKPSSDPTAYEKNKAASQQALNFMLGWFAHPIYKGGYPPVLMERLGDRLPQFTDEELKLVKGSSDFFGLNHYSTNYVELAPNDAGPASRTSYWQDIGVAQSADPSWPKTDMGWSVVPWGIRKLLEHIQSSYHPTGGIYITENGCAVYEPDVEIAKNDRPRVQYMQGYISEVHGAIQKGVNCKGYFAWSFMDNFEWAHGYSKRFGIVYVDYKTQERTPKASARWYADVIKHNAVPRA